MHLLFFIITILGVIQAASGNEHFLTQWKQFKSTHNKKYASNQEERYRMRVFKNNVALIDRHNSEADLGLHSYTLKINQFADITHAEFVATMLYGLKPSATKRSSEIYNPPSDVELPAAVDWRKKGAVTNVIENQGQCGSCWAFTATGALEGQHAIKTGNLVRLSAQNLMDCSTSFGNDGCNGGMMDYAFEYIKANNGIDTEASYPYEARDGTCRFKRDTVGATDTGYVDLPVGNETALTIAIALVGPISTAIDAETQSESFQFYSSGVYDEPNCGTQLCHSFVLVGYDTFNNGTVSKDYYIAKNSWGDTWGMNGYVWMSRNKKNQCGIANMGSYPTV